MGLPLSNLRVLLERVMPRIANMPPRNLRPKRYAVLLGRPEVQFTAGQFAAMCREAGIAFTPPDEWNDMAPWHCLGFKTIVVDVSDYEGADVIQDLNAPLRPSLVGVADLVFDPGTLEHCFDLRQAMTNILDLTCQNGTILHHNPLQGWADHGYYTPSPCMFHEWYEANGCSAIETWIADIGARLADQNNVTHATPLPYDHTSTKRWGSGRWVQYTVATKRAKRGPIVVPTQRRYTATLWNQ